MPRRNSGTKVGGAITDMVIRLITSRRRDRFRNPQLKPLAYRWHLQLGDAVVQLGEVFRRAATTSCVPQELTDGRACRHLVPAAEDDVQWRVQHEWGAQNVAFS